uniref:STAS domain-containing protein n=1 Tax=Meloidogyne hapla TaxID=6305 RepID=A0A1I8BS64_MELHA
MTNVAMNRLFDAHKGEMPNIVSNGNASDLNVWNLLPLSPIIVSSTLACCIGLVTLAMGILRLDMISTYFSDQVVAGFTTGASVHVFAAQLKFIFGLSGLPQRSGAGNLIMFLNPLLKKRFNLNVPIPFELFLMVLGTFLSFLFHGHSKFGLEIVDRIPAGIPTPIMPDLTLLPELLPDAIAIAAVELFALGFSSTLSSFFPVYPVSCSLGRTLVNVEANTKTQLSTIFSCAFLAAIILYFGQWLRTLPMCILSSIIVVALKGIFRKIADLRRLWPLSRIDFAIWLVSFVSTVCWDVSQGLVISIGFALLTTVKLHFSWHFLANLSGTNDFRDAERYELISTFPGICIFRFDSPLLFTNVDNFKTIHKAFQRWKRYQGAQLGLHVVGSTLRLRHTTSTPSLQIFTKLSSNGIIVPANLSPQTSLQQKQNIHSKQLEAVDGKIDCSFDSPQHLHFIVDCSGFTFVDCMGVNALKEIFTEMRQQRVRVYFAAAKAPVRDLFEKSGFYEYVPKRNFYPTIRDAVALARMRRSASSQNLLDESTAHRVYDEIETMQITQPEQ